MSIVAQKITYIHPDNQVLFKGIDLTINKGQIRGYRETDHHRYFLSILVSHILNQFTL